jgi:hypothetical protein
MSARFVSSDRITVVDLVRLSAKPGHQDGEWLRIWRHGLLVGTVRTVPELAQIVDLTDLSEVLRAVVGLWAASD